MEDVSLLGIAASANVGIATIQRNQPNPPVAINTGMALTSLDICSAALVKIGANPIQSFSDNTREAQVSAVIYPIASNSELSSYPWVFNGNQIELNQTTIVPLDATWNYAFQLPNDMLSLRHVYAAGGFNINYFVEDYLLYAVEGQVFADYIRALTEAQWPYYFVDLVVAKCAYEFALAVVGIGSDIDRAEKEYGQKKARAQNLDANQNQPQSLINPANSSLVRSRFGWQGVGTGGWVGGYWG